MKDELTHKEVSARGGRTTFKNRGKEFLRANSLKAIKSRLDLGQITQEGYDKAVERINAKFDALPE